MADLNLRPGYGYWDITSYPVGGSLHRAPKSTSLLVTRIEKMAPYKGADRVGYLENGNKIAFAYLSTEEGEAERRLQWESQ